MPSIGQAIPLQSFRSVPFSEVFEDPVVWARRGNPPIPSKVKTNYCILHLPPQTRRVQHSIDLWVLEAAYYMPANTALIHIADATTGYWLRAKSRKCVVAGPGCGVSSAATWFLQSSRPMILEMSGGRGHHVEFITGPREE